MSTEQLEKLSTEIEVPDWVTVSYKKPNILVELMGYEKDISYDLIKSAFSKKIHVVTGNKA